MNENVLVFTVGNRALFGVVFGNCLRTLQSIAPFTLRMRSIRQGVGRSSCHKAQMRPEGKKVALHDGIAQKIRDYLAFYQLHYCGLSAA